MPRRRRWRWLAALVVAAAGLALMLRPPPARRWAPVPRQPLLWRGAYHVHSTQSDGSGTPEAIAAAAAAGGLDFVILTDHGDGTRTPRAPHLVDGVLMIDAAEVSTDDGHLVALGLPRSPYPLAGEGRAVVADVRRLGGVSILAHPDSPRSELAWRDSSADADGFEWINADTTWRTAGVAQLFGHLLTYGLNRAGTLAGLARYPDALFAGRDQPTRPPQLAMAAVDAHARIGWQRGADPLEGGRTLATFPAYRASFGTFGVVVPWLDGAPSGDPARDAVAVLHAIRNRVAYTAVFSMASPTWLSVELVEPAVTALPGPDARGAATLTVRSNAPDDAIVRVLRNGVHVRDAGPADFSMPLPADAGPAIYRAELWLPARRGWPDLPVAVSAARGHNLPPMPGHGSRGAGNEKADSGVGSRDSGVDGPAPSIRADGHALGISGWHVEHDPASSGAIRPGGESGVITARLALASGGRTSQFAALVADLAPPPGSATALELELSASGPMRLSVQFRAPRAGEGLRWRHSTFVDSTRRVVSLPLADFRPIRPASGEVARDRLHALLLVMDTVHAHPGDHREVTVHRARWRLDR